ncbi:MAG: hypothetical protein AAF492_02200, partial [Verrucomicrobiota bacterium]
CEPPDTAREGDFRAAAENGRVRFSSSLQSVSISNCLGRTVVTDLMVSASAALCDELTIQGPFAHYAIRYTVFEIRHDVPGVASNFLSSPAILQNGYPAGIQLYQQEPGLRLITSWMTVTNGQPFEVQLAGNVHFQEPEAVDREFLISEITLGAYGDLDWTNGVSILSSNGSAYALGFERLEPCVPRPTHINASLTYSMTAYSESSPPGAETVQHSATENWVSTPAAWPNFPRYAMPIKFPLRSGWFEAEVELDVLFDFSDNDLKLTSEVVVTNTVSPGISNVIGGLSMNVSYILESDCLMTFILNRYALTHVTGNAMQPELYSGAGLFGPSDIVFATNDVGTLNIIRTYPEGRYHFHSGFTTIATNYNHLGQYLVENLDISINKILLRDVSFQGDDVVLDLDLMPVGADIVIQQFIEPTWQEIDRFRARSTATNRVVTGGHILSNAFFRATAEY